LPRSIENLVNLRNFECNPDLVKDLPESLKAKCRINRTEEDLEKANIMFARKFLSMEEEDERNAEETE
jgi:hypothetical protein